MHPIIAAASQAWWQDLLIFVLTAVATVLFPALIAYIVALLRKKKIAVEFDIVWAAVGQAVSYGEQEWKKALKDGADPKDKAAKTMQTATDQLEKLSKQWGLPKMAKEKLIELIEAKVGEINSKKE